MTNPRTAFVLGGGGLLGAAEVGMMASLLENDITPDLIVGTSIGALNGALLAADPTPAGVRRIQALWVNSVADGSFGSSLRSRVSALASQRGVAASSPGPLRRLLEANLPFTLIEELPVEFACVAASIERAAEHWFTEGPIVPAVLASAALPGMFPPVEIDGEHYLDGGLVNSIPLDRARKLGAQRAFVLQVGRIEQPLRAPSRPWEVPMVALEVTRRARFHASLERSKRTMEVHVLPTGGLAPRATERANFDPFDTSRVTERMAAAQEASLAYLIEHGIIRDRGTAPTRSAPQPVVDRRRRTGRTRILRKQAGSPGDAAQLAGDRAGSTRVQAGSIKDWAGYTGDSARHGDDEVGSTGNQARHSDDEAGSTGNQARHSDDEAGSTGNQARQGEDGAGSAEGSALPASDRAHLGPDTDVAPTDPTHGERP